MKALSYNSTENKLVMPLISWDIFSQFSLNTIVNRNTKNNDINQLLYFSNKLNLNKKMASSILSHNRYEALVLTNKSREILWVNEGFTEMTGYSKDFAIKKTPVFLQGEATTEKKRLNIRKKLNEETSFKEVIINYKKDGTPYHCEIQIFPLVNNETTYYLALETAV